MAQPARVHAHLAEILPNTALHKVSWKFYTSFIELIH